MSEADDLATHMHGAGHAYLIALFDRCRRRFVEAARLMGVDLAQWPGLAGGDRVDLTPLMPFWDRVCTRYIEERGETQFALYDRTPSAIEAFSRYIHWELWPALGMENGAVRAVLRAVGALPAEDRDAAARFLVAHVEAMPSIIPYRVACDLANLDSL